MLNFPDVRQPNDHDCAAACVKMADMFFGNGDKPFTYYSKKLISSAKDGTDPRTVERFLRSIGYNVISGEMNRPQLGWFGGKNYPVMVLLNGHYVLFRGIVKDRVHVQDPYTGPRSIELAVFDETWDDHDRIQDFKHWGIAIWKER